MTIASESAETHYRQALENGRFEIQRCGSCTQYAFPPRIICPNCGKPDMQWQATKGHGTVYACTIVSRRTEQGGPYNVVLVDLDEGVRLMSTLPTYTGDEVPLGMSVNARIEHDNKHRLVFDPA